MRLWHNMPSMEKAMPTRNLVLTDHQEKLIKKLVESGRYQNASEVLREGLRLVEQRDAIMRGLRTLHVARRGRRGRHLLLYRVAEAQIIEIARILHDQMDSERHLPFSEGEGGG